MPQLQQKVPVQAGPEGKAVRVDLRDAPTQEKAEKRREAFVERYQGEFPELCRGFLAEAAASLNPFAVPTRQQPYGRPSTRVERAFVEEQRRTTVIPHPWTEGS